MTKSKKYVFIGIVAFFFAAGFANNKYHYDPLGRLSRVDYEDGASVVYTYDRLGNRKKVTPVATADAPDPNIIGGRKVIFVPHGGGVGVIVID